MEVSGAFMGTTFILKSGRQLLVRFYNMMAGIPANFGLKSQIIPPISHMFPTR